MKEAGLKTNDLIDPYLGTVFHHPLKRRGCHRESGSQGVGTASRGSLVAYAGQVGILGYHRHLHPQGGLIGSVDEL